MAQAKNEFTSVSGLRAESVGEPATHTLSIQGTGETTNYALSVTEGLVGVDDSVEQWDGVSETSADGWVTSAGSTDSYEFRGDVTAFEFKQGAARVSLDGAEVDPSEIVG